MALFGRFFRLLIALVFFCLGYAVAQFANGNGEQITVSVSPYSFKAPVFLLALVPLGAGLLLGWLYTVPARTAEFADHWRQWRTLRQMEKENKQLRKSLDKVLDLPDEAAPALSGRELAALPAKDHRLEAEPVVVHEVKSHTANGNAKGRRPAAKAATRAHPKAVVRVEAEDTSLEPKPAARRRTRPTPQATPAANPA
jgi:lipopolysaccharide assembly LapA-like protein